MKIALPPGRYTVHSVAYRLKQLALLKHTLVLFLALSCFSLAQAQQLAVTSVTPNPVCAGSSITANYTYTAGDAGTLYVYLNGPAATDVLITALSVNGGNGSLQATLPADRTTGTYSVRLIRISGTTGVINSPNSSGFTINAIPSAPGVSNVAYCLGATGIYPGGLSVSTSFQLTMNPMPTTPTGFTIMDVSTVSCEVLSAGERRLTFTPQYAGLSGDPISFSVVNEKLPTTDPGPYSLNLYTDNPAITLSAKQAGSSATYRYNWLLVGTANTRLGVAESGTNLQVKVLGNPVVGSQVEIEISGATNQLVVLRLVDLQGRPLHEQRIESAGSTERVLVPVGSGRGLLLLKVSTATQQQQVKLLKL